MTVFGFVFRQSLPPASGRRGALARLWRPLALMLVLFGALHVAGTTPRAEAADGSRLPCDRYALPTNSVAATPCVAAHSTVRALFAAYNGPLYQVKRASDGKTQDIGLLAKGGYANAAAQDSFCANTPCTITLLYDQTAKHNDLIITPKVSGNANGGAADNGAPAEALPVTAGGHQAYGISFSGKMGYHSPVGQVDVATGSQPEGMYMVTSGTHTNDQCCFDYGNGEKTIKDDGDAQMDAVFFGNRCEISPCTGSGPWVRADLENGLFASTDGGETNYSGNTQPYVTVLLKNNGTTVFTLKSGNAQSAGLVQQFSGSLPTHTNNGTQFNYDPMKKQGGIVLGTGGDDSDGSIGSFFEGVMTQGYPADGADDDVQANIVSVGYGAPTGSVGSLSPGSEISLQTSAPNSMTYLLAAPAGSPTTVATVTSPTPAATWIVRRGLANNNCLSFEAKSYPGAFLRHKSAVLYADPDDGQVLTTQDETFCPAGGLSGQSGTTSFQVTTPNYTNRYIGQYGGKGVTEAASGDQPQDNQASFKSDVSWVVTKPLVP